MTSDSWKVATFNANSIRARLAQVLGWLEHTDVDVLAVQETKVQDDDFPAEEIRSAGFHVVYRGQKSRAGVAIISRSEPQEVRYGLDNGKDEARLIRCVIDVGDDIKVPLVNSYVPQGRQMESDEFRYKLRWFKQLCELFDREYEPDEPLLWLGDLNVAPEPIDVFAPKRHEGHVDYNPQVREALEEVRAWGFIDVVRQQHPDEPNLYTYWDYRAKNPVAENKGWRVDHIMATKPLAERCVAAWIDTDARLVERPSDHTFVVAEFEF
jgi:exodeoxyribonuclease III